VEEQSESDVELGGCGMQIPHSATWVRGWFASFRPRQIVLSSPYPASECIRRLALVTTQRSFTSWHLDAHNASCRAPQFRGTISQSWISVARFEDAAGRNSFAPWLQARLEGSVSGGTTLTGSIGLHPAVRVVIPILAAVAGLIAVSAFAGGVVMLISGHVSGALPAVLMPLALTAFIAGFYAAGLKTLNRAIPKLVQELNATLGSSAFSPYPVGVQAVGNDADPGCC
jgi:hypothetical protein